MGGTSGLEKSGPVSWEITVTVTVEDVALPVELLVAPADGPDVEPLLLHAASRLAPAMIPTPTINLRIRTTLSGQARMITHRGRRCIFDGYASMVYLLDSIATGNLNRKFRVCQ
jgi:hypothetical protein